jgi:hypothetical protein
MTDLIDSLGGPTELARLLGIKSRMVVWNWKERGIPWRYRNKVAKIAKSARVRLPEDFLEPNADAA